SGMRKGRPLPCSCGGNHPKVWQPALDLNRTMCCSQPVPAIADRQARRPGGGANRPGLPPGGEGEEAGGAKASSRAPLGGLPATAAWLQNGVSIDDGPDWAWAASAVPACETAKPNAIAATMN